jgi:hypothetical protein
MSDTSSTSTQTRTQIKFDLAAEITAEELAKFEESAAAAGAESLTEHFLNLSLRTHHLLTQPSA